MDGLLVVGGLTEIGTAVLRLVVGSIEAVEHITIMLIGTAVVAAEKHGERLPVGERPTFAAIETEREVADRGDLLHRPIVVKRIGGQRYAVVNPRIARERRVNAVGQPTHTAIETEPIGGRRLGTIERAEMGLVVDGTAQLHAPRLILGDILGLHKHHTTRIVGRVFRGG